MTEELISAYWIYAIIFAPIATLFGGYAFGYGIHRERMRIQIEKVSDPDARQMLTQLLDSPAKEG